MRRAGTVLAATGLTAAAHIGFGAPSASAAPVGCASGNLCFYADPGYSGGTGQVGGDNSDFRAFSTSRNNCGNGTWNDCISSAWNNGRQCTVYLYSDAGYRGVRHSLGRGDGYYNLKDIGFDDVISSNRWCQA